MTDRYLEDGLPPWLTGTSGIRKSIQKLPQSALPMPPKNPATFIDSGKTLTYLAVLMAEIVHADGSRTWAPLVRDGSSRWSSLSKICEQVACAAGEKQATLPFPKIKLPKLHGTERKGVGAGYQADPEKRRVVERYAEDKAVAHYEAQGWTVKRIGKPYDLRCTRMGSKERHVEVKGTTGAPTSVELTFNEVEHARTPGNTVDLFVVSDIRIHEDNGEYRASHGVVTHRLNWKPADEDLRPTKFEYRIPSE